MATAFRIFNTPATNVAKTPLQTSNFLAKASF